MSKQPQLLVLNGPNLNMLGVREPSIYGSATHKDVETLCKKTAASLGFAADCRQSNHEGEIVTWIQKSRATHKGIVINAGAYTHTSIAVLDALLLSEIPIVEVHITNIFRRENFRQQSFVSQASLGIISGLGIEGYAYAIDYLAKHLGAHNRKKA